MDQLTLTVCPQNAEETRVMAEAALEALVKANEVYYMRFPRGPCCPHCAGIKYRPPTEAEMAQPGEQFDSVERLIVKGYGACGPIAAMVAARMRVLEGRDVRVKVIPTRIIEGKRRDFHAVVELDDGSIYDPTAELARLTECPCPE